MSSDRDIDRENGSKPKNEENGSSTVNAGQSPSHRLEHMGGIFEILLFITPTVVRSSLAVSRIAADI